MKKQAAVVLVFGLVLIAGCSQSAEATPTATALPELPESVEPTEGPTPVPELADSPEDILGAWQGNRFSQLYIEFRDDSTAHVDVDLELLADDPFWKLEYWFEGTQLHMRETHVRTDHPGGTCEDSVSIYEVELHVTGKIRFVAMDDQCDVRRNPLMGATPDIYVDFGPVP